MRMRITCLSVTAAACLLLSGCGGGGTTTHAHKSAPRPVARPVSGHATVTIKNFMYHPMVLTVTAGTKVTFHNEDDTAHTATALNGGFNTGTVKPGKSSTVTLRKVGTDKYHCLFHAFMVARIVVVKPG
jgi:plastocyanin